MPWIQYSYNEDGTNHLGLNLEMYRLVKDTNPVRIPSPSEYIR